MSSSWRFDVSGRMSDLVSITALSLWRERADGLCLRGGTSGEERADLLFSRGGLKHDADMPGIPPSYFSCLDDDGLRALTLVKGQLEGVADVQRRSADDPASRDRQIMEGTGAFSAAGKVHRKLDLEPLSLSGGHAAILPHPMASI